VGKKKIRRHPRLRHLSSGEMAEIAGLSKRSIVKAVATGRLQAARTVGGHYRISFTEARRFLNVLGMETYELDCRESCALVLTRDNNLAKTLTGVLGRIGIEVLQAADAFQAGALSAQYHPRIIMLDAAPVKADVLSCCRSMLGMECLRQASILALIDKDELKEDDFLAAGANAVLRKPFSTRQLKSALQQLGFSTGVFRRVSK